MKPEPSNIMFVGPGGKYSRPCTKCGTSLVNKAHVLVNSRYAGMGDVHDVEEVFCLHCVIKGLGYDHQPVNELGWAVTIDSAK